MARSLRIVGAALLACTSVPVAGVGVAHADTAVKTATNYGYFSSTGIDKPDESPADPPNVTSDHADGVGPGHLGVAARGNQEDKSSFLLFDLFDLDPTGTITKAVLRVPTVADAPPDDFSFQATPDKVAACKAGSEGFTQDEGNGLALAPKRLCTEFKAVGKASADKKAYEFDVTALASEWLSGDNDGVALTPADLSSNFQVVFDKAENATLTLDYTPPATVLPPVTPPVVSTPVTPAVDSGFAPAPSSGFGSVPDVSAPLVPAPQTNPAPQAAPQQPVTTPQLSPVAVKTPSMRPTNGFWLAGFGLAAALALLSLVVGDTNVPAAAASRSRLSSALASRQGLAQAKAGFGSSSNVRIRPV